MNACGDKMSGPSDAHAGGNKRKFPGPAGLLVSSCIMDTPSKSLRSDIQHASFTSMSTAEVRSRERESLSQVSSDLVSCPAWKALLYDLGTDAQATISKFGIRTMLLKAQRRLLPKGKIPLIVGLVDSLDMQGRDAQVVIRDSSGKMHGCLHRDLFKDSLGAIEAGCVVVLRQVSVINPSPRTFYLNITPGNVVFVYAPDSEGARVDKTLWEGSPLRTVDSNASDSDSSKKCSLVELVRECEKELRDSPSLPLRSRQCTPASSSSSFQSSPMFHPRNKDNHSSPFRSPMFLPRKETPSLLMSSSPKSPAVPCPRFPLVAKEASVAAKSLSSLITSSVTPWHRTGSPVTAPRGVPLSAGLPSCDADVSSFLEDNDDEELLLLCDSPVVDAAAAAAITTTTEKSHVAAARDSAVVSSCSYGSGSRLDSSALSLISCVSNSVRTSISTGLGTMLSTGAGRADLRFPVKEPHREEMTLKSPTTCGADIVTSAYPPKEFQQSLSLHGKACGELSARGGPGSNVTGLLKSSLQTAVGGDSEDMKRDGRVELGKDVQWSVALKTSAPAGEDFWDNELSEELLSQLSEDF
ncbi:uncharacterized protein LOC101856949 isoform X2 [Aplysia californica]|nr:uncharacterized protein LOC101856949 isoform X2 [Aplysia californica]